MWMVFFFPYSFLDPFQEKGCCQQEPGRSQVDDSGRAVASGPGKGLAEKDRSDSTVEDDDRHVQSADSSQVFPAEEFRPTHP